MLEIATMFMILCVGAICGVAVAFIMTAFIGQYFLVIAKLCKGEYLIPTWHSTENGRIHYVNENTFSYKELLIDCIPYYRLCHFLLGYY